MNLRSCVLVVVVVPSIIHNIRIHRLYTGFGKSFFHFCKCRLYVGIVDGHHIVIPGVVLCTEITSGSNAVNILIEIRLNNVHIGTSCRTCYGLPGHIFAICGKLIILLQFCKSLTGEITHMCIFICVDLGLSHRELTSKEHTLNVNRLSKRDNISAHTADTRTHGRMCPGCIAVIDI